MNDKTHDRFRELVMEQLDGRISLSGNNELESHLNTCPECMKYRADMKIIIKAASEIKFEAPAYLESKIMAAVNQAAKKKEPVLFGFGNRGILGAGVSFALVLFAASFLIYNNMNEKKNMVTVAHNPASAVKPQQVAAVAVKHLNKTAVAAPAKVVVAAKPAESAQVTAAAPVVNQAPVTAANAPVKYEKHVVTYDYSNVQPKAAPVTGNNVLAAAPSVAGDQQASAIAAPKVSSAGYKTAKNETPTPSNPLLDQEKAVVANNLIDPSKGQAATIKVLVETDAHVKVVVYDKAIRVVATLIDDDKTPGAYQVNWFGKNDSNQTVHEGVYFVFIQIGNRVIKKNIIVAK